MDNLGNIFEVLMIVLFGISWPLNIIKSLKSKTTKGKSLLFLIFIFVGYLFGITSKLILGKINYVLVFYIINTLMVGFDLILYFRNKKLDKLRESSI